MQTIINDIRQRAGEQHKRIILPEWTDPRVLKAAAYLTEARLCRVLLPGRKEDIKTAASDNNLDLPSEIEFISYSHNTLPEAMTEHLYQRRKHKGVTPKKAAQMLIEDPLCLAATLIATGEVDGGVAGSVATTGAVIRAAIQCIGLRSGMKTISSTFLMALDDGRTLTYADCGVVPYPDPRQLAEIAIASARTHKKLTQEEPLVAMLSFSTKGSARHKRVDHVTRALTLAKEKEPALQIDGELQFDTAFVPEIARRKAPESTVAGEANVFIFPNLDAGNIGYKITERLAGATATGPILQGLARPLMDLSRGCRWEDIVNAACVAVLMGKA